MAINCLLIDDEPLAMTILEDYIANIPTLNLVGKCKNAFEAAELIRTESIQLLFLDIQMPKMTGFDFLQTLDKPIETIITTAYPEFAIKGYEFDVVDYLIKPIGESRFMKATNKALRRLKMKEVDLSIYDEDRYDYMFVKSEYKLIKINFDDILYIEGMKDYVRIVTSNKNIMSLQTMKRTLEDLPEKKFMRVHRSYIVALDKIMSVMGNSISIQQKIIPISQSYQEAFFQYIAKTK